MMCKTVLSRLKIAVVIAILSLYHSYVVSLPIEIPNKRIFTLAEMQTSEEIYLSIVGYVFDVSTGSQYYGPGESYNVLARKDATILLASGDFEKNPPVDFSEFTPDICAGADHWLHFYADHATYKLVGILPGMFFDENGNELEAMQKYEICAKEGKAKNEREEAGDSEATSVNESEVVDSIDSVSGDNENDISYNSEKDL